MTPSELKLQRAKSFLNQYLWSLTHDANEKYKEKYTPQGELSEGALVSLQQELNSTINILEHYKVNNSIQIEPQIEHLANLLSLRTLWFRVSPEDIKYLEERLEYLVFTEMEFFEHISNLWAKIDFKSPLYSFED